MGFCTLKFIFFVFVLSTIYYLVEISKRWMVLLGGSLLFFAVNGIDYLWYILLISLLFFCAANGIDKNNDLLASLDQMDHKTEREYWSKRNQYILVLTIIIVIGNLIFHKYWNLLGEMVWSIFYCTEGRRDIEWIHIALPLGLSYYTFSGLGYVLDVYWKRCKSEKNYAKFLLYLIYFPHILQGPIERFTKLQNQFFDDTRIRWEGSRIGQALLLMLWGYFKKLFIADRIGLLVTVVIARADTAPGSLLLMAVLFSGIWLYADFSGYMDIAWGVSKIFGIQINQNFNHPLLSKSISEWWRRWHMSLSSWWRDYIYMPMATSFGFISVCSKVRKKYGKRMGKFFKDSVPLLIIWTTTGLWHGTGTPYLAWGFYFSVLFIASAACSGWNQKIIEKLHIHTESRGFHIFQMIRTYLLFCAGRLLTMPGSLTQSRQIMQNIFIHFNLNALLDSNIYRWYGTRFMEVIFMAIGGIILFCVDYLEEKYEKTLVQWIYTRKWYIQSAVCAGLFLAIFLFGIYGVEYNVNGFAYQNF